MVTIMTSQQLYMVTTMTSQLFYMVTIINDQSTALHNDHLTVLPSANNDQATALHGISNHNDQSTALHYGVVECRFSFLGD